MAFPPPNAVVAGANAALNPPTTIARTSHSLTILGPDGTAIGLIQNWGPNMSRAVTPIYELNADTSGRPVENIPGNLQGLTMNVTRFDIWNRRMEQVFGSVDLYMLSNQKAPFSVRERWVWSDNSIEIWEYAGCYFTSLGRTISATDQRTVLVNSNITYLFKRPIQVPT